MLAFVKKKKRSTVFLFKIYLLYCCKNHFGVISFNKSNAIFRKNEKTKSCSLFAVTNLAGFGILQNFKGYEMASANSIVNNKKKNSHEKKIGNLLQEEFFHSSLLSTSEALEIFKNFKGDQLKSANSERKTTGLQSLWSLEMPE